MGASSLFNARPFAYFPGLNLKQNNYIMKSAVLILASKYTDKILTFFEVLYGQNFFIG